MFPLLCPLACCHHECNMWYCCPQSAGSSTVAGKDPTPELVAICVELGPWKRFLVCSLKVGCHLGACPFCGFIWYVWHTLVFQKRFGALPVEKRFAARLDGMAWHGMVPDVWRPKRPGPASDGNNVTKQTLRAGMRAPPPEKPCATHRGMGERGDRKART